MSASDELNKVGSWLQRAIAWCGEHRKVTLIVGCVLAGVILGLWARG